MSRFEITRLAAPAAPELRTMTFPAYRHLLALDPAPRHPEQGDLRPVEPLALVARQAGQPIGLVLAELPIAVRGEPLGALATSYGGVPTLLSVYVDAGERRRGIASALIAELERAVAGRGFDQLEATYTGGQPASRHLERIFARRGWSRPAARSVLVRFSPQLMLTRPPLAREKLLAMHRELDIFSWSQLGAQERAELERSHAERPWIASGLEPWRFDRRGFDPSSVGARSHGEVVGWVINHRITPDTVRFTCSFMHPRLSRRGRILPLYYAALERLDPGCRLCTFITPVNYREMVSFVRNRLAPVASFLGETLGVHIDFSQRGA